MNYREIRKAKNSYVLMRGVFESLEKEGVLKSPLEGVSIVELMRMDIAEYLMYLSAADGRIDEHEVRIFQVITGFNDTAKGIARHIREHDIYSTDYETTVPFTMKAAVKAEANKSGTASKSGGNFLPQLVYDMYETIGLTLIQADGGISKSERHDFNIYLNTLKKYMEEEDFMAR